MVDKDIITNKLNQINQYLKRIQEKFVSKDLFLSDKDTQEIILFNLHQTIQGAMDIGSHIIADENLGVPNQSREIFSILADNKIIEQNLSEKLSSMVGFSNILVHEYVKLDLKEVVSILEGDLEDLYLFCSLISDYALN